MEGKNLNIAKKRKEYRLINILFKTIYKKKSAKWRGDYLRKKHIFHHMGENVHLWGGIPSDPYLISIGNNVIIAVSVEFVTHDIFIMHLIKPIVNWENSIRTLIQLLLRIMYVLVVSRKLCPV